MTKSREYIREEALKALSYVPEDFRKLIDTYIEDLAEEKLEQKLHADGHARAVQGWVEPLSVAGVLIALTLLCGFTVRSCVYTNDEINAEAEARCDAALQTIKKMKEDDTRASAQKIEFCKP